MQTDVELVSEARASLVAGDSQPNEAPNAIIGRARGGDRACAVNAARGKCHA